MYVCICHVFFNAFYRLRALTEAKVVPYGRVVDNILLTHAFKVPSENAARDRSYHRLNCGGCVTVAATEVRAVAATVARGIG